MTTNKALVVDDDDGIRTLVSFMLEDLGFQVTTASDGIAGIKKYDEAHPDLVISDMTMPDMEGIEFLKALREKNRSVQVIMMSGNPIGEQFLNAARLLGAAGVLTKPFTKAELAAAIGGP